MKIELDADGLDMQAHQVLRFDDAEDTCVLCLRGQVWITQENELRDIVLEPGDGFTLDRGGLALASALRASSVRLEQPLRRLGAAAVPWARRSVVPSWLPALGPVAPDSAWKTSDHAWPRWPPLRLLPRAQAMIGPSAAAMRSNCASVIIPRRILRKRSSCTPETMYWKR